MTDSMIQTATAASTATPGIRPSRLTLVAALFFTTGGTGLIYEVVWTRQLINIFGATIYAVSTVLAAFMGGLALGSWRFGRWADTRRNPFRTYGVLEIAIGAAAFALPWILRALDPLFQAMYDHLQASFLLFSLIRFALVFAVLLIPTTLMGATLPMLTRYLARERRSIGARVGLLYTLNTLGAVAGCFLAGFVLIEHLGIRATTLLAVALNVAVGTVAIALSRDRPAGSERADESGSKSESESENEGGAPYPPWVPRAVLWSYAVSGAIALAYQVLWSRALVFANDIMKNTTYAFTAMLTVFLVGLALGSAMMARFVDRERDPLRLYGLIQVLIGLGGALSLYVLLYRAGELQIVDFLDWRQGRVHWIGAVVNVFYQTFAGIFAPTLMMGMAFPVAARLYVGDVRRVGGQVGRLYAMNTVGAIAGSFLGGFVIIPALGMGRGILTLALVNVAVGAALLYLNPRAPLRTRRVWAVIAAGIAAVMLLRMPPADRPFQSIDPNLERLVFYEEGPLATVSVIEGLGTRRRTIFVDNVGVAGTDPILLTDQKSLAHYPVLFHPNPKSALTVGFGSGGASHSYCLYPFMERIHCAEIADTVLKAAPDLTSSNHGIIYYETGDRSGPPILRDDARGRYAIKHDDVRSYLRFTRERYDIIATDCTDLKYKSSANLYDREYFQLCADRVNDDGLVVVWMPLGGLSDEAFRVCLRTFYRVFPRHFSIWYMNNEPTHYILLIGSKQPLRIDVGRMEQRLADPRVRDDLAEIGLDDAYKILSTFVVDERNLGEFLKGDLLNTEDFPWLEFDAPRYGFGDQPLLDNLRRLWEIRNDVQPHLAAWEGRDDPAKADLLDRYVRAADAIVRGHHAYRKLEIEEATRQYLRARSLCPEDKSIDRLLQFADLLAIVRNRPTSLWHVVKFGVALQMQGRHDEALDYLRRAVALGAEATPGETSEQRDLRQSLLKQATESLAECDRALSTR